MLRMITPTARSGCKEKWLLMLDLGELHTRPPLTLCCVLLTTATTWRWGWGWRFAFGLGARKLHFVVGARPWAQPAAAGGCWPAWSILARICWGADFWPWHMLMNRSEHMIRHILGFKFAYGFAYVSANLGRIPMRATLDPSRSATNWWVYMADGCMTPKEGEDTEQFAEDPEQKYDRKEWKEDDEDGGADGVWQMVFWFVSPLTNLYIYIYK